jgi:hypothetical protein
MDFALTIAAGRFSYKRRNVMKPQYWMYRRGKTYYVENSTTGKQESLRTSDTVEAQRILAAKNEAANNSKVTLAVGKAYNTEKRRPRCAKLGLRWIKGVTGRRVEFPINGAAVKSYR